MKKKVPNCKNCGNPWKTCICFEFDPYDDCTCYSEVDEDWDDL